MQKLRQFIVIMIFALSGLSVAGWCLPELCASQEDISETPEISAAFGMTPEEVARVHQGAKVAQSDYYEGNFKGYKVFFEYRFTENALTQINIMPRERVETRVYEENMLAIMVQLTSYYEKQPEKFTSEGNTVYVWTLDHTIVAMKWNTKTWHISFSPKKEERS